MKLYIPPLPPVPEDMKETLIREHPDGLRVVMAEELGSNAVTAGDLLGIDFADPLKLLEAEPPVTERLQ
ncbi:MAG: hypothetical protein K2X35_09995 [Bryobacteraceae bacterium]|jgi:hypothetical protein|nr:hypothetical protein [Bryobacteraceae bacterium]